MNLRLSAWAAGILLVVVTVACGGGGEQTGSSSATPTSSGIPETAAPSSPTTKPSTLKPLTVHAGPPYATAPRFMAFAELVNSNDVPVDIGAVNLRLLDGSGKELGHSEFLLGGLTARPTDFDRPPYGVAGSPLNFTPCFTPIAPGGNLGVGLRLDHPPAGIVSYELEVTARESGVNPNQFSVSDVVQSADEDYASGTATRIDARVTNLSTETQTSVTVCCGFYDHDVLYTVINSSLYPPSIGSLAPGESAPFRCGSSGDSNVLQAKFWVGSQTVLYQLEDEWSKSVSGGP